MNKRDKIRYFEDRSNSLRKEVTEAIIETLRENNLTELSLSQDDEHPVYVVWFDNDSNGYDSCVYAIRLTDEDISSWNWTAAKATNQLTQSVVGMVTLLATILTG